MNRTCDGDVFTRHGKTWGRCFLDSTLFEIAGAPTTCPNCGRPWTPMDDLFEPDASSDVAALIDLPHYKAELAAAEARAEKAEAEVARLEAKNGHCPGCDGDHLPWSDKTAEERVEAFEDAMGDLPSEDRRYLAKLFAAAQAEAEARGRRAGLEEAARFVDVYLSTSRTATPVLSASIRAIAARAPTTPLGRNEPTDNLGRKRSTTWWTGAPRYLDPATGEEVPTCRECGSLTSGGRCSNCGKEAD